MLRQLYNTELMNVCSSFRKKMNKTDVQSGVRTFNAIIPPGGRYYGNDNYSLSTEYIPLDSGERKKKRCTRF